MASFGQPFNWHQGIRWVLIGEHLFAAHELRELSPAERRRARCPSCGDSVIPKLGRVNVEHAAHRPGSVCSARGGEGALHLNAKYAIWHALRETSQRVLTIELPCLASLPAGVPVAPDTYPMLASADRCARWRPRIVVADWDDVALEYRIGERRIDLALLRGGALVCAIEVRASHAIDEEKAAALAELPFPWIEVDATVPPFSEGLSWTTGLAIRVCAFGPWRDGEPPEEFACDTHRLLPRETAATVGAHGAPILARVVDIYPVLGGPIARRCAVIDAILHEGRLVAVQGRASDETDHDRIETVELETPLAARNAFAAWKQWDATAAPLVDAVQRAWRRLERRWARGAARLDCMAWTRAEPLLAALRDPASARWWPTRYEHGANGWQLSPEFARRVWNPLRREPDPQESMRASRQELERRRARLPHFISLARALVPAGGADAPIMTPAGPAWGWQVPGEPTHGPAVRFAVVLAIRGAGRLVADGGLAWPAAAIVEKGDVDGWRAAAEAIEAAGAQAVFIALGSADGTAQGFAPPAGYATLVLQRGPGNRPDLWNVSSIGEGPRALPDVRRGLESGRLRWDAETGTWSWQS